MLDFLAIGAAFAGGFIRSGNFWNQEIIGTASTLPWAVVFGHPADEGVLSSCHPVQLYEAAFYFLTFAVLFVIAQKWGTKIKDGLIAGLFFTSVFTFRFLIEWIKQPQESGAATLLQMGQLLSLPFIAFGIYLIIRKK